MKLSSAIIVVTDVPFLVFNALVCPFNPVIIGTIAGIMSRNSHLKKEIRMRRLLISRGLNQDARMYVDTYARVFQEIPGPLQPYPQFYSRGWPFTLHNLLFIHHVSLSLRQIERVISSYCIYLYISHIFISFLVRISQSQT